MSYQAVPEGRPFDPFTRFTPQSYELVPLDSSAPIKDTKDPSQYQSQYHSQYQYQPEPTTSQPPPTGPPNKRSSTWRILWRTPATMASLFFSACIFALLHLSLFLYLDGKRADGEKSIRQSYVAALSHLLGLLFRATLSGALLVAFTQYLWRLMRQKAIKISNIETLFKITQNPFLLFQMEVVKVAPILFILATFTWVLPLAVTFPPGALTVVANPVQNTSAMTVPTYNGSQLGSKPLSDPSSQAVRYLSGGMWIYLGATPIIRRLGRLVLELDSITPFESPCGSNCTYSTQFEGPYVTCTKDVSNQTVPSLGTLNCGYNAYMGTNMTTNATDVSSNSPYGLWDIGETFNMSTTRGIYSHPKNKSLLIQEFETLTCTPSRALYKVNVTYNNGEHVIRRTEKYTGNIRDMIKPLNQYYPFDNGTYPEPLLKYLTGLNYFALIDAIVSPLTGNYTMLYSGKFYGGASSAISCGPTGGTIVADTHLNTQKDNVTRTATDGPSFHVTQDILNDALFNLTMSTAFELGFWHKNITGTMMAMHQFYSFSSLKTFLFPYLSCVFVSIPFLFLGLRSLHFNGASAIDGGFVQVLMTTTGSKNLQNAAASGCLGGEENTPEHLKNMKVRFGELISDGDPGQPRRAGFGTEEEVMPLKRGISYGQQ